MVLNLRTLKSDNQMLFSNFPFVAHNKVVLGRCFAENKLNVAMKKHSFIIDEALLGKLPQKIVRLMVDTTKEAHSGQYLQHHHLLGALLHHMCVPCDAEGHECNEKEPIRTPQTALLAPCSS